MNFDNFLGKLTTEQTAELVKEGLDLLPEPEAMNVIREWIIAAGLAEEFGMEEGGA